MTQMMTTPLATDLYQLTMMAGYQHAGITGRSTFELFVRNLPRGRGVSRGGAGIEQALDVLESLRFSADEIRVPAHCARAGGRARGVLRRPAPVLPLHGRRLGRG